MDNKNIDNIINEINDIIIEQNNDLINIINDNMIYDRDLIVKQYYTSFKDVDDNNHYKIAAKNILLKLGVKL